MNAWSKDESHKIAEADDLHISPFRQDGVTYGTPTWIWSVAVDDILYVRGYTLRTGIDRLGDCRPSSGDQESLDQLRIKPAGKRSTLSQR
jgi:Uncharacterized protein conserved in bacteria (DUF2255)